MDWKYHFLIELTPNRIPFGAKLIGKGYLQSKFSLILADSVNISLCVPQTENKVKIGITQSENW